MHPPPPLLLPLTVSAALAIAAAPWALDRPALAFFFKPLATLIVIAHAARRGHASPPLRRWVLAGLALLWPQQGFLPGLLAFLLAHLAYLLAFTRVTRLGARRAPFAACALLAGGLLAALWPGVPGGA